MIVRSLAAPLAVAAVDVAIPESTRVAVRTQGAEWNALVLGLDDADLRQGFEWGETRRDVGRRTLRYVAYDGDSAVAALAVDVWRPRGSPWSVLYASRGPVFGPAGPRAVPGLQAAASDMASRTRAVFLRCSPGLPAEGRDVHATLVRAGFAHLSDDWTVWNVPRVTMALDLRPDEAALKRAMRESTRLSLTRVQKHGGRVELETSADAVSRFHRLLVASGRRKRYPVRELAYFDSLRRHYLAHGHGCVVLASDAGEDLAGVLGVRFGRRAYLLYAALDGDSERARRLRAGIAAHWALIRWAKEAGCETLDWGGAVTCYPPHPESPGYGIYDFKRGFGCSLVRLPGYYDLVFRPALYRAFRWLETRSAPTLWRLRARLTLKDMGGSGRPPSPPLAARGAAAEPWRPSDP